MVHRVFNFNPGPATLPLTVLQEAQKELLDYSGLGMSVMEISHRSHDFEEIIGSAEELMLEVTGLSDDYQVLFLQGGASLQFAMLPLTSLPGCCRGLYHHRQLRLQSLPGSGKSRKSPYCSQHQNDNFRSIPSSTISS